MRLIFRRARTIMPPLCLSSSRANDRTGAAIALVRRASHRMMVDGHEVVTVKVWRVGVAQPAVARHRVPAHLIATVGTDLHGPSILLTRED